MNWDEVGVLLAVAIIVSSGCIYVAVSITRMTLVLTQIAIELRSQRDLLFNLASRNSK